MYIIFFLLLVQVSQMFSTVSYHQIVPFFKNGTMVYRACPLINKNNKNVKLMVGGSQPYPYSGSVLETINPHKLNAWFLETMWVWHVCVHPHSHKNW